MDWEMETDVYALLRLCVKEITSQNLLHGRGNSILYGGLNGKEMQKRGGLYVHVADSLCRTVETECSRATMRACVLSHDPLFATPWTVARQAPLSVGFSRQEYWSGSPCPPPGGLPDPGIEPARPIRSVSYVSCLGRQVLYH